MKDRLLIVDDQYRMLRHIYTDGVAGCTPPDAIAEYVSSGEEALARLRENSDAYLLVLMDGDLSEGGGWWSGPKTVAEIREISDVPIYMTGSLADEGIKAGANGKLPKENLRYELGKLWRSLT